MIKDNLIKIMKKNTFYYLIVVIIILFFPTYSSLEENVSYKWLQITGNWTIIIDRDVKYLKENKSKSIIFNYSPLVNYNSIISNEEIISFSELKVDFSINSSTVDSTLFIFFNAQSFRQFYAVQFTGNEKTIHTVALIQSNIKDTTLPKQAKGNFNITTLATKEISLEYGRTYTLTITVQGKTISAAIDTAQVLSHTLNEELEGGKIGFASKNCIPIIDNLVVYNGKEIVFADDFSKESIKKIVLQGKKLTPQEVEEEKKKKK